MDICLNDICPHWRQPQGYTKKPENEQLFDLKNALIEEVYGVYGNKASNPLLGTGVATRFYDDSFRVKNGRRRHAHGLESLIGRRSTR